MILESIRDWFEQSTSLTDVELKSIMRCHESSFTDTVHLNQSKISNQ